ncbi:MAG: serine hydrolase domain-containing protein [Bacteroidia bacterium]
MKPLFLFTFTCFVLSISCFAQKTTDDIDIQKIESLLDELGTNTGPGYAISIVKDGAPVYTKQKGYANLDHMVPITDSTKFLVGSISKQFTAFSILLLEDEGKLSINDDITKHLPELKALKHTISIKQLMNHTSGFRNTPDLYGLRGKTEKDFTSQEEMISILLRQKGINFVPGSCYQYGNSGYVLLAEIVKRVSGIPYVTFTQTRIFEPLEMKNSLFVDDPELVVKNKALSYYTYENEHYKLPMNNTFVGSTGLYTTTEDLCKWAMNFQTMTVGNASIFTKMKTRSTLNNGETFRYALGLELKAYKGLPVVFHGGGDAGYKAYLLAIPDHKLAIAITGSFDSFNPLSTVYGLVDLLLSEHIIEPAPVEVPHYTHKDLKQFEGDYQIFPGLIASMIAEEDSLFLQFYGANNKLRLPEIAANVFQYPNKPHSNFHFMKDSLHWNFSDMYYPGKKVEISPVTIDDLSEFTGIYKSEEVGTYYEFIIQDKKLVATHSYNPEITLMPIEQDTFTSFVSFFGRVAFTRDKKGKINGCHVSGQSSIDVQFRKIN